MLYWIGVILISLVGLVVAGAILLVYHYLVATMKTRAVLDTLDNYFNIESFLKTLRDYGKKNQEKDL